MSAETNMKPIEILLVEDNLGDVRLTREALTDGKVRNNLYVVRDGVEALDFLFKRGEYKNAMRPDLILLDLNLPKKDGREVLSEIKKSLDETDKNRGTLYDPDVVAVCLKLFKENAFKFDQAIMSVGERLEERF